MDEFLANKGDLKNYRDDKEIVKKTALQVRKDFAQYGFDIELPQDLKIT